VTKNRRKGWVIFFNFVSVPLIDEQPLSRGLRRLSNRRKEPVAFGVRVNGTSLKDEVLYESDGGGGGDKRRMERRR
jgi:hypothetical protein